MNSVLAFLAVFVSDQLYTVCPAVRAIYRKPVKRRPSPPPPTSSTFATAAGPLWVMRPLVSSCCRFCLRDRNKLRNTVIGRTELPKKKMDPPPLPGDGQPPPIDASTPAPVWPFNPAFTFSTLGLAENPFYMNNADMTASVAPTMDPQFMNYQFGQMGYGNLPMTTAVDPSTTFFMQNNAAQPIQQSP